MAESGEEAVEHQIHLSLENTILPKETLDRTPSSLDGLDPQTEFELRVMGTELIQTSGILLKLPQVSMATGQVLFQRFYYSKSFVRYDMETTAMACILIASKLEEDPRRVRDVANVFHYLKQLREGQEPKPFLLDAQYISRKSAIIKAERSILKNLGFVAHVKHPHKFIVTLLQILNNEKNSPLLQASWNYMNDSLRTDVFVRYPPETIACACVQLSANLLKVSLPEDPPWYEVFGGTKEDLEDIFLIILRVYTLQKTDNKKTLLAVEELKQKYDQSRVKKFQSEDEPGNSEEKSNEPDEAHEKSSEPSLVKSDPTETQTQSIPSSVVVKNDDSTSDYCHHKSRERSRSSDLSSGSSRGKSDNRTRDRSKDRSKKHRSPHSRSKSSRKLDYYDSHSRKNSSRKSPYDYNYNYSKKSSRDHDKSRTRSQKSHYKEYEDYKDYRKRK